MEGGRVGAGHAVILLVLGAVLLRALEFDDLNGKCQRPTLENSDCVGRTAISPVLLTASASSWTRMSLRKTLPQREGTAPEYGLVPLRLEPEDASQITTRRRAAGKQSRLPGP